jgi:hypothetical protein
MARRSPAMTVRNLVIRYGALCAEKNHSSLGGRKAHLNFELKDAPKARGLRPSRSLTSKFRYARVSRTMKGMV